MSRVSRGADAPAGPCRSPRWWPTEGDDPDPRWSLANERTLLAYSRTALAFLVAGVAVVGSPHFAGTGVVFAAAGIPLIAMSGVIAWTGRSRFLAAQRAMRTGDALAAPVTAVRLPLATAVMAAAWLVIAIVEVASG